MHETAFNFTPSSGKYIRKVFNTNPTAVNTNITRTAQQKTYWLGQTYERMLVDTVTASNAGGAFGAILGLDSSSTGIYSDFKYGFRAAQTPWIIAQDVQSSHVGFQPQNVVKLFKFHTLDAGEDEMKRYKISIVDIKTSKNEFNPYGSFSIEIRDAKDNDNAPVVVERYSAVNLNPNSSRYIARVIGDQYLTWSDVDRRHKVYGNYPNASKIVRVEVNADVDAGATEPALLPFGSYGPLRPNSWQFISGALESDDINTFTKNSFVKGGREICLALSSSVFLTVDRQGTSTMFSGAVVYPAIPLRVSASDNGVQNPQNAYFGIDTTQKTNSRHEDSYVDLLFPLPDAVDTFDDSDTTEPSYIFTLDDLSGSEGFGSGEAVYVSGSRQAGTSWTAVSGNYTAVLDEGYNRFTVPIHGGFNGLDITEKEPFNESRAFADGTDLTKYAYYSVKRAIDTVADPEVAEYNLMAAPGIYKSSLTNHMIDVCENRGDALAVIDIDSDYRPNTENTNSDSSNRGSVSSAVILSLIHI